VLLGLRLSQKIWIPDLSVGITLRREMLEPLEQRLRDPLLKPDDLEWSPTPTLPLKDDRTKRLMERYKQNLDSAVANHETIIRNLPDDCLVVSLHVSQQNDSLIVVQYKPSKQTPCLSLRLPFDRLSKREGEEECLTLQLMKEQFEAIMKANNTFINKAVEVKTKEERVSWWSERREIDTALGQLVRNVEHFWLGAFKACENE
jgi:separase